MASTFEALWAAMRRGAFQGAAVGFQAAHFVILAWWYRGEPAWIIDSLGVGVLSGGGVFGIAGLIWQKTHPPFRRLEADLKSAARLRDQELINEADYQALKSRVLEHYRPRPQYDLWQLVRVISWGIALGITFPLVDLAFPSNLYVGEYLGLVAAFIAVGAVIGGSIAYAFESIRSRRPGDTPLPILDAPNVRTLEERTRSFRPLGAEMNEAGAPARRK